jgi:hypothetical protein
MRIEESGITTPLEPLLPEIALLSTDNGFIVMPVY